MNMRVALEEVVCPDNQRGKVAIAAEASPAPADLRKNERLLDGDMFDLGVGIERVIEQARTYQIARQLPIVNVYAISLIAGWRRS
jgi:hypothetical protein